MANRDFENWGGCRNVVARRFGLAESLLFLCLYVSSSQLHCAKIRVRTAMSSILL